MRFLLAGVVICLCTVLRALTFIRNETRRRVEIGAPPGAKQCGWRLAPSIDG